MSLSAPTTQKINPNLIIHTSGEGNNCAFNCLIHAWRFELLEMTSTFATAFKNYYGLEKVAEIPNDNKELRNLLINKLKLTPIDMELLFGNFLRKKMAQWLKTRGDIEYLDTLHNLLASDAGRGEEISSNKDIWPAEKLKHFDNMQDPTKQAQIFPTDLAHFVAGALKRNIQIVQPFVSCTGQIIPNTVSTVCSTIAAPNNSKLDFLTIHFTTSSSTGSGHFELVLPTTITNGVEIASTYNEASRAAKTNQGAIATAIATADRSANDNAANRVKARHTAIKNYFTQLVTEKQPNQETINTQTNSITSTSSIPRSSETNKPKSAKSETEKQFDTLMADPDLKTKFKNGLEEYLTTQKTTIFTKDEASQITKNYFNYGPISKTPDAKKQIMADALVAIDLQKEVDEEKTNTSHSPSP